MAEIFSLARAPASHPNFTGNRSEHENSVDVSIDALHDNSGKNIDTYLPTTNTKRKSDNELCPSSNKSKKSRRATFISINSLPRNVLASALSTASVASGSTEFSKNRRTSNNTEASTSSSGQSSPPKEKLEATTTNPTVKVLEALTKFQTCLLILSNTVVSLHESLKLILPRNSTAMPATLGRAFSCRKTISQPDLSLDNNNVFKDITPSLDPSPVPNKTDNVVVSISTSSSAATSLETVTSNGSSTSIVSECGGGGDHQRQKSIRCGEKEPQRCSRLRTTFSKLARYVGLFLALFASVCMSLVTLVVKFMEGYHPVSKVIWRLQGVLLPSLLILLYVKYYKKQALIAWQDSGTTQDISKNWKWKLFILLIARGVVGCSADIFQYYSLKYLLLADSTVISFSTPIFVCILAKFVLKEKTGYVTMFAAVLTLCGVIVITKPPILTGEVEMSNTALLGNILALLCMISATFTCVIMRYLKHVHFAITMLALGIVGTLEGFVPVHIAISDASL